MKPGIYNYLKKNFLTVLLSVFLLSAQSVNAQSEEVINLGLYGGASQDFSWAYNTNRLFSTVETPATLFYTNDTCANWIQAFPNDSLEYETAGTTRGWGGGGRRVVSNWNSGWVGLETQEQGGTLTSSVISFSEGDSGTFRTAYDGYLLHQVDPSFTTNTQVTAVGMSDSWFYIGLNSALVRINDTTTYGAYNVLFKSDTSTVMGANTNINWLAVGSDESGYPVLFVANVPGDDYGKLFSFDGTTITEITGIVSTHGFERVFIHPADTSIDTLIVSARNKSSSLNRIMRSYDGGSSWTDITPGSFETSWPLQNADYNPDWVSQMPNSNGMRLSFPGVDKSDDLGDTWSSHMLPDNASATHPVDTNYVVGSKNKGPQLSLGGAEGTFTNPDNEGHAAVRITKIAQNDTDIYYVATKAGLGYTTAYKDPSVQGVDQWRPPYGDFPIAGVGDDSGVSSVAVDPSDSLHVIAGGSGGFYITTTGAAGFSFVQPTGWDSGSQLDYHVSDVKFISYDTIVAVTGTGSNRLPDPSKDYGNIWITYDGGATWSKTAPTDTDDLGATVDFEQGNNVVIGFGTTDTIIYTGGGYWDQNDPKAGGQIWKSDDFGVTWSFVNHGPTGQKASTADMPIYDMDIHPNPDSNEVLYIASGENLDNAFCKTTDGGATYTYFAVNGHGAFSSVLVKLTNPDIVSVAARRNLFRCNTTIGSSTIVFEGLPGEFVPDLETGSTLLGTSRGLFKLVETPGSVITKWNGTGDWSNTANWSNGIPYDICNAIIESGEITLDVDAELNDLTMNPETALTLTSGFTLVANGDFKLESDANGYASFIDDGTLAVTGTIKVEKYISQDQWHYITSPVENQTSDVFTGLYLKYWDESSKQWVYVTSTTEDLLAGKGYSTWSSGSTTGNTVVTFSGEMYTGDYSPFVSLGGDPDQDYGWNLVGNSFPSAIDWGTDNNPNTDFVKTNLDNTIYLWNGTQYATYNPSGDGGDGLGTNGATQYIASAQGFFVHANASSPALSIPQSSRLHNTQAFMKTETITDNQIALNVSSEQYSDETVVAFNDLAIDEFEPRYDAYKLDGIDEAPQLYTISKYEKLAVNTLPFEGDFMSIPVYFKSGIAGTHTINTSGMEGFADDVFISLEDKNEDITINLKEQSYYTFYAHPSDNADRFILHFDATTMGVPEFDTPDNILIFANNNKIVLENIDGEAIKGRVQIIDILGRTVFSNKLDDNNKVTIDTYLHQGTYIVIFNNGSFIKTKKINIR